MAHVLWLCYRACEYYDRPFIAKSQEQLSPRQMRNLLVAAMFHDFDHSGMNGNDDLNIERACRALRKHLHPMDTEHAPLIDELIRVTEYPYTSPSDRLTLSGQILRDADVSQALSVAWIQQVIFGLSAEWGIPPIEVLKVQEPFLRSLCFHTAWANEEFRRKDIEAKIDESKELFALLQ